MAALEDVAQHLNSAVKSYTIGQKLMYTEEAVEGLLEHARHQDTEIKTLKARLQELEPATIEKPAR